MGVSEPTQPAAPAAPSSDVEPRTKPVFPDLSADHPDQGAQGSGNPLPAVPPGVVIPPAQPVRVDNATRRSGNDALEGLFCDIVSGPYAGRWGVFEHVIEFDGTGYPKRIMVISRDERNERLEVDYSDARPSQRLGGR